MAMSADGRTDALFSAIVAANPRANNMSADEKNAMRASIKSIFGQADLNYVIANADVLPSTFQAPSTNCTVTTTTGPASGATVAAGITGLGKVS